MYFNARYMSPYLNRWLQPDSIVPEPGNPQDLNRYAYGRNNPLRFIDPSGHFSEEAVQAYLRSYYGEDQWEKVFNAWKGNKDWWAMISAAQAGDILFGGDEDGGGFMYEFLGNGQDRLDGVKRVGGSSPYSHSLDEMRWGSQQVSSFNDGNGSTYYGVRRVTWVGFVRDLTTNPTWYTRPGYQRFDMITPDWVRDWTNRAWGFAGFWAGLAVPGGKEVKAIAMGLGLSVSLTEVSNMWEDFAGIEKEDVRVVVGPASFKLKQNVPGAGWKFESYSWVR
jgi:hypothetical protein